MRALLSAVLLALAMTGSVTAHAETPPAAAKTKAAYKVQETDLGTMLDDPASKAILLKHIPEIVNSPQIEMGRGMTLAQLQQFAGDQLTDEKLATIQTELDAVKPH